MKVNFDYLFFLFFVADLFLPSIEAKDYYKILAVPKSATEKQIKKAFREKAKLLHPDKNDSPNAEQQFRELAEGKSDLISIIAEAKCITVVLFFPAYEVLSDPQKRQEYDHGSRGFRYKKGTRASNFDFNFDDLFKQFEDDIFGSDMDKHFKTHFGSHFANHHQASGGAFSFDDLFANDDPLGFGGGFMDVDFGSGSSKQHCKTVTQRVNNMVTTYTHCS